MFTMSLPASSHIPLQRLGLFASLMVVAWLPFTGGARVPSLVLALLALWQVGTRWNAVCATRWFRRLATIFLLLLIPVLISVPASFSPGASLRIAAALIGFFLVAVAVTTLLENERNRSWFEWGVTIVLLAWVGDAMIQYLAGRDLLGIPLGPDRRVTGPFPGNTFLSLVLMLFAPIAISRLLSRGLWAALAAFGVLVLAALLTGVRTSYVFVAVLSVALVVGLGRRALPVVLIGAIIGIGAVALSPSLHKRLPDPRQLLTTDFEQWDAILTQRLRIWETALHMARDRPWTGVGAGAFESAYDTYSTREQDMFRDGVVRVYHAHQLYFGVVAETGFTGLAAFVIAVIVIARWYLSSGNEARGNAWPYAVGLLIYGFPLSSQPVLYSLRTFPLLVLLVAGLLASLESESTPGVNKLK